MSILQKYTKCALLVIDMQEHFRSIAKPILSNLRKTIEACKSKGIPVIYTQHGHKDPQNDSGALGRWWSLEDCIEYGSQSWKLMPEILVDPNPQIIHKNRYDAFYKTNLEELLKNLNAECVVVSGVMTNLCCETTARSAFVRDFDVIFLSDGTATSSLKMQQATLMNMEFGFAKVLSCKEFMNRI